MSSPPATPAQTTSRRGRILQPTKCKLQAPITTFVKTFKKARTALTPGRRDSAEAGLSKPDDSGSTSHDIPTPPTSLAPAPSAHSAPTSAHPHSATTSTQGPRASKSVVIEDSDDDENDDQSSNGDVLLVDDNVIMLNAAPTSLSTVGSKGKGSEGTSSSKQGMEDKQGASPITLSSFLFQKVS